MKTEGIVDHLFRHQYGKMVSILTHIFGLTNLEIIEDAVQDTFIKAMHQWTIKTPENPEAWLTKAAKNRAIDLLRKLKTDGNKIIQLDDNTSENSIDDFFLDHEIEDSQLRMIFTACHPKLNPKDQIAFALKTISGFSDKEIAVALLLKEETIKKRLTRARKTIREQSISFEIPGEKDSLTRINNVLQVLYLIFNEGYHSTKSSILIQKELCGEAIRLCSILLKKEHLRNGETYALFALFCFHSSRLETKVQNDLLIDLEHQDRAMWYKPLIQLGNDSLTKSMGYDYISPYHLEAAIAAEHVNAETFESTDWNTILTLHQRLHNHSPTDYSAMNLAIVLLQLNKNHKAKDILDTINPVNLEKRKYLLYGVYSKYYSSINNKNEAINYLLLALKDVSNTSEKNYLENKLNMLYK